MMPTILTAFLAASLAVVCVAFAGIFASVGLVLINLHTMARYAGRKTVAAWRRWRLRGWMNRLCRPLHRPQSESVQTPRGRAA